MFQFGSFDDICGQAALVVCPLIGATQGIEPTCYSRNVDIGSTLIFQPGLWNLCRFFCARVDTRSSLATSFVHIVAIIMTGIMIYHIRSKYTAVGESDLVLALANMLTIGLQAGKKSSCSFTYTHLSRLLQSSSTRALYLPLTLSIQYVGAHLRHCHPRFWFSTLES